MSYRHDLPAAGLGFAIEVPKEFAAEIAGILLNGDSNAPSGTSFAITSEPLADPDRRTVYMSRASKSRIQALLDEAKQRMEEGHIG